MPDGEPVIVPTELHPTASVITPAGEIPAAFCETCGGPIDEPKLGRRFCRPSCRAKAGLKRHDERIRREALLPFEVTNAKRDRAMAQVGQKAEDVCPGFHERAQSFVLAFLASHGPTAGELVTLACKAAGLTPHDDRAFGPVYMALARAGRIVRVGNCRRERGHGTSGGNVWAVTEAARQSGLTIYALRPPAQRELGDVS
jgi:hypothetical protein